MNSFGWRKERVLLSVFSSVTGELFPKSESVGLRVVSVSENPRMLVLEASEDMISSSFCIKSGESVTGVSDGVSAPSTEAPPTSAWISGTSRGVSGVSTIASFFSSVSKSDFASDFCMRNSGFCARTVSSVGGLPPEPVELLSSPVLPPLPCPSGSAGAVS
jgi:hypothetical protein